jgi:zinc protease
MDSIKPSQKYQAIAKLALLTMLAGIILLLWTNRNTINNTSSIMLIKPQEVKSVLNNETYKKIDGMLNIHHWQLENGAKVYFVPTPHLPMLDVDVTFDAGSARNPKGKGGLSYLVSHLLAEGTGDLSADQVAIKLDELGVEFSSESHRDMAVVHLRTLTEADVLTKAIDIFSSILQSPSFPTESLEREKNNTLISLKYEKQSPGKVASRVFFETLYKDEPYGNWRLGNPEDIESITSSDLKQYHKAYYTAQNSVITLVGAIDIDSANNIAHQIAANLPQGEKAQKVPTPKALKGKLNQHVEFPSEQTHIMIGALGMSRDNSDYYPLYVGNHILGGGSLTSRVFEIVRNQNGLAYSVYSYFLPMSATGPFIMNCQTRNDQVQKAEDLLTSTLQDFIQKGPTPDELELAKKNLLGGYALDFDSNYSISRQIASMGFYDLPLDTFNLFKQKVEALSVDDIQQAFTRHLSTDNLLVVKVGA